MDREEFERTYELQRVKRQVRAINVDACTDAELVQLVAHPAIHLEVKRYAEILQAARKARLAGEIRMALRLEVKADRVYDTLLPKNLCW